MKTHISFITCFQLLWSISFGQAPFDIDIYKVFVSTHEDITPAELHELFPSDVFASSVPEYDMSTVLFLDEMDRTYNLTDDEKALLMNNGFMVTERLREGSFFTQFVDVYKNDLPVFVSTDAILHAFHLSYDELLKQVELSYLIPELKNLLGNAHNSLNKLDGKYGQLEEMIPMLRDVDVYLAVARRLLGDPAQAFYQSHHQAVWYVHRYSHHGFPVASSEPFSDHARSLTA